MAAVCTKIVAAFQALSFHSEKIQPEVVHANDWATLPAAIAAKKQFKAKIVYDTHEFATQEHAERALWRLLYQPAIKSIERARR